MNNAARYLGKTKKELLSLFEYDELNGKLYRTKPYSPFCRQSEERSSERKNIGNLTPHGYTYSMRENKKLVQYSLGKLCYFLHHEVEILPGSKINYIDGDFSNLKPDNLSLVTKSPVSASGRLKVQNTEVDGVVYNPNNGFYIARRGKDQAIYRTLSYQEAVAIRKEWEEDNTIHHWDRTTEVFRYKYGL